MNVLSENHFNKFLNNKYLKLYINIIQKAIDKNRRKKTRVYYELHHVVPRSFGGSNEKINLVLLAAREHFIVHHLSLKCTVGKYQHKMSMAFNFLVYGKNSLKENIKITASQYKICKENHANAISKTHTGKIVSKKTCSKISASKMGHVVTEETKRKIGIANKGRKVPQEIRDKVSAFHKGRIVSKETREKLSKVGRGRIVSKETGRKISTANKGKRIGKNHHHATKCNTPMGIFDCYKDAAGPNNCCNSSIGVGCRSTEERWKDHHNID